MLRITRLPTIVVAVLAAAVFATGAAAEDAPPPIEQYVEQVPTAQGERPVVGKGGTVSKPLAPSVKKQLGGATAKKPSSPAQREQREAEDQILGLVAGSPNYGATDANGGKAGGQQTGQGSAGGQQAGQGSAGAGDGATGAAGNASRATKPDGQGEGVARTVDADRAASANASGTEDADGIGSPRIAALVAILLVIAATALVAARWRRRTAG